MCTRLYQTSSIVAVSSALRLAQFCDDQIIACAASDPTISKRLSVQQLRLLWLWNQISMRQLTVGKINGSDNKH